MKKRWSGKKIASERTIGVLGGTFDPPHVGHLLLAETARDQLGLDKVLFVPVRQPPHKNTNDVSPSAHRLAMTKLAIAGNSRFFVDTTDIDRPPPHYTATLLPLIKSRYPQHSIWLLIGSDSLRDFLSWHQPAEVLRHSELAVLPRPGVTVDWDNMAAMLPELEASVTWLDGPSVAISAGQIRQWCTAGRSLRYMTPPGVIEYIKEQRIYTPSS